MNLSHQRIQMRRVNAIALPIDPGPREPKLPVSGRERKHITQKRVDEVQPQLRCEQLSSTSHNRFLSRPGRNPNADRVTGEADVCHESAATTPE